MQKNKTMVIDETDYIDLLDEVSTVECKLKLMQTVLGVLINTVEKEEANTQGKALRFAAKQDIISDFLHVVLDGVYFAIQTLDRLQRGGDHHE